MPDALPEAAVYIVTSLDGYVAREDGGLDGLPGFAAGEDYGYAASMATVDALVMSRHPYETVRSFDAWPNGETRVVVLSHCGVDVPEALRRTVAVRADEPADVLHGLGPEGVRRVYLDGGRTTQGFLRGGLVTEMVLTRVPALPGSGIPTFGPPGGDVRLQHVETEASPGGLVQSRYRVAPGPSRGQSGRPPTRRGGAGDPVGAVGAPRE
ncbi:dihydrofolate reductase family protein [Rubrivirga marina]|uniref:Bacterial bifunctional deaminase-reductase C-terminal domain-containing protein n=1 Tax=Rubrivirga marina TaxID=1196024 RepID=A0A271J2S3_9BACT|nr:dihydrofolate reductase family protein [Rubrivirga marina]PAP77265.1 hypothetical protein BSZ37_12885 [Rubrivirga marina]